MGGVHFNGINICRMPDKQLKAKQVAGPRTTRIEALADLGV